MKCFYVYIIFAIILLSGCAGTPELRRYYDYKCNTSDYRQKNPTYCEFLSEVVIPARPGVGFADFVGAATDMTLQHHNRQLENIGAK